MDDKADNTLSRETHEALLEKALKDAASSQGAALQASAQEVAQLSSVKTELETEKAALEADNERLNQELDQAQIQLKALAEENEALKADVAKREHDAAAAKVAADRAAQVENLGLFSKEYIAEKAARWAEIDDTSWTDRLDEWAALKPATPAAGTSADSASAMSGSTESLTKDADKASAAPTPNRRRAALGLS